jgi:hypothetical protein
VLSSCVGETEGQGSVGAWETFHVTFFYIYLKQISICICFYDTKGRLGKLSKYKYRMSVKCNFQIAIL